MIKSFSLTAIFILTIVPTFSQKIIKGKVLEQHNNKPIPFANIGILYSHIGGISNEDGSFTISVPITHAGDTLLFSALGYRTRRIPISKIDANKPLTILLSEKITLLDAVTVSAKKEKRKTFWLGNKFHKGGNIYGDSIAAGAAMALLIENKYPAYHSDLAFPVFIEKALLRISSNRLDEFKVRIRFLEVDSLTKLPGKDLFNESLIVTSRITSGWLTFDLSPYGFVMDKPSFFLVFEWILDDIDRLNLLNRYKQYQKENPEKVTVDTIVVRGEKIPYYNWYNFTAGTSFGVSPLPFSLSNYQSFYRLNSFGEWRRAATILTARLLVSDRPSADTGSMNARRNVSRKSTICLEAPPICKAINQCEEFLEEGTVNGLQITVSVKSKTVLSKGFGFSDITKGELVSTNTRFRIGSISKALTSAALIKLAAEGKLNLDVSVQDYVSSYPQKRYKITTRQLAGHLAGIRHYSKNELTPKEHYSNCVESISIFANDSLLFNPGTQYHYSSYGWNLIGAVIEKASGNNYLDYMSKKIWKPLAMLRTYGDIADSVMTDKSKFYDVTGEEVEQYDLSSKYPSGGLLSTTDDLVRYGNELLHGNYLDSALKNQIFTEQLTADNKPTKYGLGWNIVKDKNGHRVWYHAGILRESSGYLLIYPDDDIVVAFLANSGSGLSFDIQTIGELFYKG